MPINIVAKNWQGVAQGDGRFYSDPSKYVPPGSGGGVTNPSVPDVTATDALLILPTVANADRYRVRASAGGSAFVELGRSPEPVFIANGLTPNTAYDFQWLAEDEDGAVLSTWSSSISATTAAVIFTRRLPVFPTAWVDTKYSLPTGGTTWNCSNAADFTNALANSAPGDVIVLQAGTTYTGNWQLPAKSNPQNKWIYIISSQLANLPAKTRVTPAHASSMPRLACNASTGPLITAAPGAAMYRFCGLHLQANAYVTNLMEFTPQAPSLAAMAKDIIFDRCLLRGDPSNGCRRAVYFDVVRGAFIHCYLDHFKEAGADSQCILATGTPGPLKVHDCWLEGAGENAMTGGSGSGIVGTFPRDITYTRNTFFKPLSWMTENGGTWTVKNSLEYKSGERSIVVGNTFQNFWPQGQAFCFAITPRTEDGSMPFFKVTDILFYANRFEDIWGWFNFLDLDVGQTSEATGRMLVRDNLVTTRWLRPVMTGTLLWNILHGQAHNITFDHNTVIDYYSDLANFAASSYVSSIYFNTGGTPKQENFTHRNNIWPGMSLGINSPGGTGTAALNHSCSNYTFTANALFGGTQTLPTGNFFPATTSAIGFTNYLARDFSLSSSSPYKAAGTDGLDLGCNMSVIPALTERFDFYIGPSGSDANPGTLASPWAITALNTKRAFYRGLKVGLIDGTYNVHATHTANAAQYQPTFNIEGGWLDTPTVIKSVNPRGAHIVAKNGSTYGGNTALVEHPGVLGNNHSFGVANGHLVIDGLRLSGALSTMLRFGLLDSAGGAVTTRGIVVQNCELFDMNGSTIATPGGSHSAISLNNCTGAIVRNNWIHDLQTYGASNTADLSACIQQNSRNSLYEYNTVENAGAKGIHDKRGAGFTNAGGGTVRYNFLDLSAYVGTTFSTGVSDFVGNPGVVVPGTTLAVHNNVVISAGGIKLDGGNVAGTRSSSETHTVHNNTLILPSGVSNGYGSFFSTTAHTPGHNFFNNIMWSPDGIALQTNDLGVVMVPVGPGAVVDYNLYPFSAAKWTTFANNAGAYPSASYATLPLWRTATGKEAATLSFPLNANPFTDTGARADRYKLAGGSLPINFGRAGGVSTGIAVNAGAWGGEFPPARIGCNFAT